MCSSGSAAMAVDCRGEASSGLPALLQEEPSFKIEHEQAEAGLPVQRRENCRRAVRARRRRRPSRASGGSDKSASRTEALYLSAPCRAVSAGERPADFGAEQIHILADLVRVRVFESGSVLAELPGHAGHGDLAHAVAAGCGEAFGDEVADTDESGCGQLRQVDLRAGFGAPASAEDHCRTAGKKVRFHADADGMDVGFMAVGTDPGRWCLKARCRP